MLSAPETEFNQTTKDLAELSARFFITIIWSSNLAKDKRCEKEYVEFYVGRNGVSVIKSTEGGRTSLTTQNEG